MKKIFLFILLILGLGACVNPMDKYTESFKKLPDILAEKIKSNMELAKSLGEKLEASKDLLNSDISQLGVNDIEKINDILKEAETILSSQDFQIALLQVKNDPELNKLIKDNVDEQRAKITEALNDNSISADVKVQLEATLKNVDSILGLIKL